jgi:hypothetical protein
MFLQLIPCFGFLEKKLQVLLEYLPTLVEIRRKKFKG